MLDQGTLSCPRFFIVNSRIKIPLWDVHVHFDRAGSHKMSVTDLSLPKVSFYQRTVFVFLVMSISCGRRWTSGTLWNLKRRFAWQMQDMYNCIGHFVIRVAGVATLPKRGQTRVKMRDAFGSHCAWRSQYLDYVPKGWEMSFCETGVIVNLGHDHDSVWQVKHFACLGLIFRCKCSTLHTSTKKWLRPGWKNIYFNMFIFIIYFQCSFFEVGAMFCENLCSRNPLVTLCVSDRSPDGPVRLLMSLAQTPRHFGHNHSRWGAVRILLSLAQPSCDFGCAGPLLSCMRHGADFSWVPEILVEQEILWSPWKVLLWRSCKSFTVQSWRSVRQGLVDVQRCPY